MGFFNLTLFGMNPWGACNSSWSSIAAGGTGTGFSDRSLLSLRCCMALRRSSIEFNCSVMVICSSFGCVARSFIIGSSLEPRSLWGLSTGEAGSLNETFAGLQRGLRSLGQRKARAGGLRVDLFLREEASLSLLLMADRRHLLFDLVAFSEFEDILNSC